MDKKDKPYSIRDIFERMELDLISSMHRAFYFHQVEEEKEGFQFEQWQLTKLREMEKYRKRNKDLVDSYSAPIQEAIDRELRDNFSKGESRVAKFIERVKNFFKSKSKKTNENSFPKDIAPSGTIREYIANLLHRPIQAPPEQNFFGVNENKLEALISTVKNDLNKAQYSVLRKMDDVYRQTIFKTHMCLQNGTKTVNQAIDMATKDFLDKGINSIQYKDGKMVNIASYAEMCLRTASQRATFLGEGKKRDEFGIHLVVVTAHANTCKLCAPWQGKVLIDDVFSHPSKDYIEEYSKKYKLLSEAIKSGLMHPNCRHTITTYFEGITQIPIVPDKDKAIGTYEAEQKQRAYERQIRKWKRVSIGSCDETNIEVANRQTKFYQSKIRELLKKHPELRRDYNKEKADIRSIQEINYKSDLREYNGYKEVLGGEAPKTLEDFQNLKYNNFKEYEIKKREYNTIKKIKEKPTYSDLYKSKMIDTYYDFKNEGYEFTDHSLNRFLGQKIGKNKKQFSKDELLNVLKNKINYKQIDGRNIRFYNGIAVLSNSETGEIVSIVTRKNIKTDWSEI